MRREGTGLGNRTAGGRQVHAHCSYGYNSVHTHGLPWKSACLQPFHAGKYMLVWVEARMTFPWSFRKLCFRTELPLSHPLFGMCL